ncbi:hypothetical protein NGRA_2581 [Nosema granulosis]|uniref:Uncharacterized protein n=1 Tax=Nosema granulosis TaxID=83296 RepID=A0A9P6GZL0_9MICR|nr:hypothetical protein NGRA_2581 [Nosema granulosis]
MENKKSEPSMENKKSEPSMENKKSEPPMENKKIVSDSSGEYEDYFGFISDYKKIKNKDESNSYSCKERDNEEESSKSTSTTFTDSTSSKESTSFSIVESCSEENVYKLNPKILWNKREYFYNLDQSAREKIWKIFERRVKSNQRPSVVDKDLNEDAFYSTYGITPSYDIGFLRDDSYIKRVLCCENLRILNIKFLEYNSKNSKEIERYIQLYKQSNEPIYKAIVFQKKRIEYLINKARSYISDISLKGEEAYKFLEKIYYIVFKKSSRLDHLKANKMYC